MIFLLPRTHKHTYLSSVSWKVVPLLLELKYRVPGLRTAMLVDILSFCTLSYLNERHPPRFQGQLPNASTAAACVPWKNSNTGAHGTVPMYVTNKISCYTMTICITYYTRSTSKLYLNIIVCFIIAGFMQRRVGRQSECKISSNVSVLQEFAYHFFKLISLNKHIKYTIQISWLCKVINCTENCKEA